MSSVIVQGIARPMGGLKESLATFRKNGKEVGDALLNISGIDTVTGEAVDKDDPRPNYDHHEFPRMLYHAEKGEQVVRDKDAMRAEMAAGWRTKPYVKAQVYVGDPASEKKEMIERNTQLSGELTEMREKMAKLEQMLSERGK